jgi:SH3-like domain-containing protein
LKKLFAATALFAFACSSSTPVEPPPAASPSVAPASAPAKTIVYVTASSVNVRRDPSMTGEVLKQAKKNDAMVQLATGDDWTNVQLADGTIGWVASRFVSQSLTASSQAPKKGAGCNTDFAFVKTPKPAFSEGAAKHGLVVVDAYVSPGGDVTSTKIITNDTGDDGLAALAQREIKSARFEAPKRNCIAKSFIFTYKRSF